MLLSHTERLYRPADAERTAAILTAADDEGWTYTAVHDPAGTGYSYIAVYDEEQVYIGKY